MPFSTETLANALKSDDIIVRKAVFHYLSNGPLQPLEITLAVLDAIDAFGHDHAFGRHFGFGYLPLDHDAVDRLIPGLDDLRSTRRKHVLTWLGNHAPGDSLVPHVDELSRFASPQKPKQKNRLNRFTRANRFFDNIAYSVAASSRTAEETLKAVPGLVAACLRSKGASATERTEGELAAAARHFGRCTQPAMLEKELATLFEFDLEKPFGEQDYRAAFALIASGIAGRPATPSVIIDLIAGDWEWHAELLDEALPRMVTPEMVPALLKHIEDSSEMFQFVILPALAHCQDLVTVRKIRDVLESGIINEGSILGGILCSMVMHDIHEATECAERIVMSDPTNVEFTVIQEALYARAVLVGDRKKASPSVGKFLAERELECLGSLNKEIAHYLAPITGRNDPCPCGSGKKFKKCCLRKS